MRPAPTSGAKLPADSTFRSRLSRSNEERKRRLRKIQEAVYEDNLPHIFTASLTPPFHTPWMPPTHEAKSVAPPSTIPATIEPPKSSQPTPATRAHRSVRQDQSILSLTPKTKRYHDHGNVNGGGASTDSDGSTSDDIIGNGSAHHLKILATQTPTTKRTQTPRTVRRMHMTPSHRFNTADALLEDELASPSEGFHTPTSARHGRSPAVRTARSPAVRTSCSPAAHAEKQATSSRQKSLIRSTGALGESSDDELATVEFSAFKVKIPRRQAIRALGSHNSPAQVLRYVFDAASDMRGRSPTRRKVVALPEMTLSQEEHGQGRRGSGSAAGATTSLSRGKANTLDPVVSADTGPSLASFTSSDPGEDSIFLRKPNSSGQTVSTAVPKSRRKSSLAAIPPSDPGTSVPMSDAAPSSPQNLTFDEQDLEGPGDEVSEAEPAKTHEAPTEGPLQSLESDLAQKDLNQDEITDGELHTYAVVESLVESVVERTETPTREPTPVSVTEAATSNFKSIDTASKVSPIGFHDSMATLSVPATTSFPVDTMETIAVSASDIRKDSKPFYVLETSTERHVEPLLHIASQSEPEPVGELDPKVASTEAYQEAVAEAPTEGTVEASTETTVEASTERTVEALTERTVDASTERTVEALTERTVDASTERTVEASIRLPAEEPISDAEEPSECPTVENTARPLSSSSSPVSVKEPLLPTASQVSNSEHNLPSPLPEIEPLKDVPLTETLSKKAPGAGEALGEVGIVAETEASVEVENTFICSERPGQGLGAEITDTSSLPNPLARGSDAEEDEQAIVDSQLISEAHIECSVIEIHEEPNLAEEAQSDETSKLSVVEAPEIATRDYNPGFGLKDVDDSNDFIVSSPLAEPSMTAPKFKGKRKQVNNTPQKRHDYLQEASPLRDQRQAQRADLSQSSPQQGGSWDMPLRKRLRMSAAGQDDNDEDDSFTFGTQMPDFIQAPPAAMLERYGHPGAMGFGAVVGMDSIADTAIEETILAEIGAQRSGDAPDESAVVDGAGHNSTLVGNDVIAATTPAATDALAGEVEDDDLLLMSSPPEVSNTPYSKKRARSDNGHNCGGDVQGKNANVSAATASRTKATLPFEPQITVAPINTASSTTSSSSAPDSSGRGASVAPEQTTPTTPPRPAPSTTAQRTLTTPAPAHSPATHSPLVVSLSKTSEASIYDLPESPHTNTLQQVARFSRIVRQSPNSPAQSQHFMYSQAQLQARMAMSASTTSSATKARRQRQHQHQRSSGGSGFGDATVAASGAFTGISAVAAAATGAHARPLQAGSSATSASAAPETPATTARTRAIASTHVSAAAVAVEVAAETAPEAAIAVAGQEQDQNQQQQQQQQQYELERAQQDQEALFCAASPWMDEPSSVNFGAAGSQDDSILLRIPGPSQLPSDFSFSLLTPTNLTKNPWAMDARSADNTTTTTTIISPNLPPSAHSQLLQSSALRKAHRTPALADPSTPTPGPTSALASTPTPTPANMSTSLRGTPSSSSAAAAAALRPGRRAHIMDLLPSASAARAASSSPSGAPARDDFVCRSFASFMAGAPRTTISRSSSTTASLARRPRGILKPRHNTGGGGGGGRAASPASSSSSLSLMQRARKRVSWAPALGSTSIFTVAKGRTRRRQTSPPPEGDGAAGDGSESGSAGAEESSQLLTKHLDALRKRGASALQHDGADEPGQKSKKQRLLLPSASQQVQHSQPMDAMAVAFLVADNDVMPGSQADTENYPDVFKAAGDAADEDGHDMGSGDGDGEASEKEAAPVAMEMEMEAETEAEADDVSYVMDNLEDFLGMPFSVDDEIKKQAQLAAQG